MDQCTLGAAFVGPFRDLVPGPWKIFSRVVRLNLKPKLNLTSYAQNQSRRPHWLVREGDWRLNCCDRCERLKNAAWCKNMDLSKSERNWEVQNEHPYDLHFIHRPGAKFVTLPRRSHRHPRSDRCVGPGGNGSVVIITEAEFNDWRETVHLLSGPKNAETLFRVYAKPRLVA
jgi:hypothetical protein